jgi:hypothetical protein
MSKRTSHVIDREQAFVKALTTASFIYNIAKNCSKENDKNCVCSDGKQNSSNDIMWPGCKHLFDLNDQEYRNSSKNAIAFANHHNERAGKVVRQFIRLKFLSVNLIRYTLISRQLKTH